MGFEIADIVQVVKHRCCFGYPRGTELSILKKVEDKGQPFFLCLPVNPELRKGITRNGLWHCASCIEKVNKEEKSVGSSN